jgi:hypothetical protein
MRNINRSPEQWYERSGIVLFTWSIINPNGPTISCVGLRSTDKEAEVELFYRWMHFLGGETFVIGVIDGSESAENFDIKLREMLSKAFSEEVGLVLEKFPLVSAVPSFVTIPNPPLGEADVFELILSSAEFKNADWGAQIYYLEKFNSRYFERAAEETRNAIENFKKTSQFDTEDAKMYADFVEIKHNNLSGFKNWTPDQFSSRQMEENDAKKWWATVYREEFIHDCLSQIGYAWVGAIFQHRSGDKSKQIAESFEDVKNFMSFMKHDMWPSSWTTDLLLQDMNLK